MSKLVAIALGLVALAACGTEDPCQDYIEYMCNCHASEVDCDQIKNAYANADPDLQDQCNTELAQQEKDDDANGVVCEQQARLAAP